MLGLFIYLSGAVVSFVLLKYLMPMVSHKVDDDDVIIAGAVSLFSWILVIALVILMILYTKPVAAVGRKIAIWFKGA